MELKDKHIFNLTDKKSAPLWFVLVLIISLLIIALLQHNYFTKTYSEKDLIAFEKVLHSKELKLQKIFSGLSGRFEKENPMTVLNSQSEKLRKLAEQQGISLFYYDEGILSYWSDYSISLRSHWLSGMSSPVYQSANAIFVTQTQETENGILYGLISIKTAYPYENEYLENHYQKEFHLSPDIGLFRQTDPGLLDVQNMQGDYLFSLDLSSNLKRNALNVVSSTLLFMIAILALFGFLSIRTDAMQTARERRRWLSISSLIMLTLSVLIIKFEFPKIIFESNLFKPDVFASLNFASLGHLWVFVMLILMITLFFYWFFNRSRELSKGLRVLVASSLVVIGSLWFVFLHHLGESLVKDSTISFEPFKLNSLSVYTFIGLFILVMAFIVFCLLLDKAIRLLNILRWKSETVFIIITGLLVQMPFLFLNIWRIEAMTPVFFLLISGSLIYIRTVSPKIRFSRFFVLLLLFSIFLTVDLQVHTTEKLKSQKEIELAKLSSEHDAVAEMLFSDLSFQLRSDSLLLKRLSYQIIDIDLVFDYLQRTYFSGYWTKYDLQITLCRPPDSVLIETPESNWFPCYTFFGDLVNEEGIIVEGSDFYFLNNLNGRISYMGEIPYETITGEITLFIEMDSKIISEELGYPSLLLRGNKDRAISFSYAKYNNGKLVTSGGTYDYRRSSDFYTNRENTFEEIKSEGYDHDIFNVDPENTVIVSLPIVSFSKILISFSYLFAFIFVLFSFSYLIASASHIKATVTWDFKNKIQYSVIGILFLTFLVICSGTIFFVIQQYRMKHQDNLENTMRSLYIELVHKVEYEEDLRNWSSDSYFNLDELLRKFANVFYTDINMYDEYGALLASSRSEIFNQQLLSTRMNREAFEKLSRENYSVFIHTEKIGNMKYQSAYVPLLNNENRFLAYLNLPYFTQPEILTQEVTNMVVAILNTYVILLLLILFLSVLLADRITQPLRFIQSRIAQLNLSDNNEKIVYKGKDEIAGLVNEYNFMVDELVKSAELLAQSERETAWREMAKQIAHEIKNPLTPMKLNVQHMQRMLSEDSDNIKERVEKVSQNLIEQIDLLTAIANEFSDFSMMPKAKNRDINLVRKLQNVANLFKNNKGVHIELNLGDITELKTYGDPEQFQRVIINLIKNGIQSTPDNREKKIEISLEKAPENTAIITISDNGKGIPKSIQEKLFQPNFTTKSSGMGMGLAISASIVKSMNGNIWYSTRENEGTKFFVKIPVVK